MMTRFLTAPVLYALSGLVLLLGLALGVQSLRLANERAAHAETRATHAEQSERVAQLTALAAEKAAEARAAFHQHNSAAKAKRDQEVTDAYKRGHAAGAGIRTGAVVVREVWRDRECPQADAGPGAEPAGRDQAVDPGRADAIGRVLGHGGAFDAEYQFVYARLVSAQGLLDACYDKAAKVAP